jgi:hypothetical protein
VVACKLARVAVEGGLVQPLGGDAALQLGGPVAACAQGRQDWLQLRAVKGGRGRIAAEILPQTQPAGAAALCPGSEQVQLASLHR